MRATEALGGFEAIPAASEEDVERARDAYFEVARSLTPLEPGKLLIDKNPLSMNSIPAIRRLFPDARVILALRHPCDVVLSCYVTNFKPNNAMASFLSLETAAELYDLSFELFEKSRELLKPALHVNRYEKLVDDRDRELRPLLDFLELDWDERVLDHEVDRPGARPHQDRQLRAGRRADLQALCRTLGELSQAPRAGAPDPGAVGGEVRLRPVK